MATRPSLLPQWASNLLQVVQPPPGRKESGFAPGEEPPAGWANWLWNLGYLWNEYLRDVLDETAVALGGTNADDLPALTEQGEFTPEFTTSFASGPTFDFTPQGYYWRVGNTVSCLVSMAWTNTDATQDAEAVSILPPFDVRAFAEGLTPDLLKAPGVIDHAFSSFGSQGASFTTVNALASAVPQAILVQGRGTTMASGSVNLFYGNDARQLRFGVSYVTDGTFNY